MMFKASLLLTALLSVDAKRSVKPEGKISSKSKAGKKLLSKARKLNDGGDVDFTWIAQYDIKYTGCSSLVQVREEGGDEEGLLYTQNLVKFSLCPSDGQCYGCKNGAEYVVNMQEFLDVYTEYKMNEKEQKCEYVRETCYCNGYNDEDVCMNQCFIDQGLDYCVEYDDGQEAFEVQEYLECAELGEGNNNNNGNNNYNYNNGNNNGQANWYGQYYIGPYCNEKDGFSINLGVFYDETCSSRAPDVSPYADRNYGAELPYSSEPIVEANCISCMQVDDDDNNNNYNYNNNNNNGNNNNNNNNNNYYYQNMEVSEMCEGVYEQAAKCEGNLANVAYADSTGCEFISQILPRLESATRNVNRSGRAGVSKPFAWIFGFTTLLFGSYSAFLYSKLSRGRVALNSAMA